MLRCDVHTVLCASFALDERANQYDIQGKAVGNRGRVGSSSTQVHGSTGPRGIVLEQVPRLPILRRLLPLELINQFDLIYSFFVLQE